MCCVSPLVALLAEQWSELTDVKKIKMMVYGLTDYVNRGVMEVLTTCLVVTFPLLLLYCFSLVYTNYPHTPVRRAQVVHNLRLHYYLSWRTQPEGGGGAARGVRVQYAPHVSLSVEFRFHELSSSTVQCQ